MSDEGAGTFRRILVPTDFGDSARRATDVAVDFAKRDDAVVTLVHAFELPFDSYSGFMSTPQEVVTQLEEAARGQLASELAELRKRLPSAQSLLLVGYPATEIVVAIQTTRADLVIMGTHGRRGLSRFLVGSVAERVLRESRVPVLTVK